MIGDGDAFGKGDTTEEIIDKGPEVDNNNDETLDDAHIPELENQRDVDDKVEGEDEDGTEEGEGDTNDIEQDAEEEVDMM